MLTTLRIKNFKAHKYTELRMARVTVLIGPQGSGKSTVAQALQLLRQSSGGADLPLTGPFEDLQYVDIIHQRKDRLLLGFGIDLECAGAPAFMSSTGEYRVSYDIAFYATGLREHSATYEIGEIHWEFRTPKTGKWSVPDGFQAGDRPPVKFFGSTYALHPFTYKINERDYALHRGINDLRLSVSDFFKQFQMVPENRLVVRNIYPLSEIPDNAPQNIEQIINRAAREWSIRDEMSEYLSRVLRRRINFRVASGGVEIEIADGLAAPYPVMCEGGGLRSLIWPLAALACAQPGSLVAIEEPEIHLHPKALAELSALLVSVSEEKDLQLLLTSHNEHLLLSLLSAVANGQLPKEDLEIYYFEERAGEVSARRLEIDLDGQVVGGLPGFFEATLSELEGLMSALRSEKNEAE